MLQSIETTGKTEAEAIQHALDQLHMDRDEVSVEIVERAKSGFLGIGGTQAKIRVTYDDGEEAPKEVEAPKAETSAPAKRVFAEEKLSGRKTSSAPAEEKPAAEERPKKERQPKAEKKPQPEFVPEDLGEEVQDETAAAVKTFLSGLMEKMGNTVEIKVYRPEEDRYKVILEGEQLGQLIGRRGETLDAIQQLTNYSINRNNDKRARIQVDAENYRAKREDSLNRLAEKVAAKVVKYRRNVTLEPMNAYERHVIHTALQEYDQVTTYSIGAEPNRRVVVAFDRTRPQ